MSSFLSFASVMLQFYFQVPKADSVSKGSRRQNIREKARTGRCSILYINTGKRCLLSKQTLKQWSHFWLAVWHQWVWWHGHAWFQGVSNVFFKEFVNHWLWMKCLCVPVISLWLYQQWSDQETTHTARTDVYCIPATQHRITVCFDVIWNHTKPKFVSHSNWMMALVSEKKEACHLNKNMEPVWFCSLPLVLSWMCTGIRFLIIDGTFKHL